MPLFFDDSQICSEHKGAPNECGFVASSAWYLYDEEICANLPVESLESRELIPEVCLDLSSLPLNEVSRPLRAELDNGSLG